MKAIEDFWNEIKSAVDLNVAEFDPIRPMMFFEPTPSPDKAPGTPTEVVMFPLPLDSNKPLAYMMARLLLKSTKAKWYFIISEAWAATYDKTDTFVEPSKSDKRIEVITVAGSDDLGKRFFKSFEIKRDSGGKRTLIKNALMDDVIPQRGDMIELLDE